MIRVQPAEGVGGKGGPLYREEGDDALFETTD